MIGDALELIADVARIGFQIALWLVLGAVVLGVAITVIAVFIGAIGAVRAPKPGREPKPILTRYGREYGEPHPDPRRRQWTEDDL